MLAVMYGVFSFLASQPPALSIDPPRCVTETRTEIRKIERRDKVKLDRATLVESGRGTNDETKRLQINFEIRKQGARKGGPGYFIVMSAPEKGRCKLESAEAVPQTEVGP